MFKKTYYASFLWFIIISESASFVYQSIPWESIRYEFDNTFGLFFIEIGFYKDLEIFVRVDHGPSLQLVSYEIHLGHEIHN